MKYICDCGVTYPMDEEAARITEAVARQWWFRPKDYRQPKRRVGRKKVKKPATYMILRDDL